MSKIRCIIIEDEPLAVKVLSDYIREVSFLELQGSFKDAILALEFLGGSDTDLIFLDIHLPKLKGLDFLRTLLRRYITHKRIYYGEPAPMYKLFSDQKPRHQYLHNFPFFLVRNLLAE